MVFTEDFTAKLEEIKVNRQASVYIYGLNNHASPKLAKMRLRDKQKLDVEAAHALADALKQNYVIRTLSIKGLYSGELRKAFASGLQNNTSIHTLKISPSSIDSSVANALINHQSIHTLEIVSSSSANHEQFEAKQMGALSDLFQQSQNLHHLTLNCVMNRYLAVPLANALFIQDISIKDACLEEMTCWAHIIQKNKTLKKIEFRNSKFGFKGAENFARALKANTSLEHIKLVSTGIEQDGIGNIGVQAMGKMLAVNTTLTYVDFSSSSISDHGAWVFAEGLKLNESLKTLILYCNKIGDKGFAAFAEALKINKTLTSINFGANPVTEKGIAVLANTLKNDNRTLLRISFSGYLINFVYGGLKEIHPMITSEATIVALGEILEVNPVLSHLCLRNNKLSMLNTQRLANSLRKNQGLTQLDYELNNAGDVGAKALAESLRLHPCLTKINLEVNNIGDEGAAALLSLAANPRLKKILLFQNLSRFFFPDNLKAVTSDFIKNGIAFNEISAELMRQINNQLDKNAIVAAGLAESSLSLVEPAAANIIPAIDVGQPSNSQAPQFDSSWQVRYSMMINSEELEEGALLGAGGFGKVYQGQWQHNPVAIKVLHVQALSESACEEFKKEAGMMAGLRHPQIVSLYGITVSPRYSLVMEYLPKGSLYTVLHSAEPLDWPVRQQIAKDVAKGLAFLHSKDIVHRDLKSLNILLNAHFQAKITDFGLAMVKKESSTKSSQVGIQAAGTMLWMAPELFRRGGKCTPESDVYSLGMVLWEIAARKHPFEDAERIEMVPVWVQNGEREDIPVDTPSSYAQIIRRCWDAEPSKRPTAVQVVTSLQQDEEALEIDISQLSLGTSSSAAQSGYAGNLASQVLSGDYADNLASGADVGSTSSQSFSYSQQEGQSFSPNPSSSEVSNLNSGSSSDRAYTSFNQS